MMLSGKGAVAGIIGWPVSHSLSPKLHNYWLRQYGIDGAYVPFAVKQEDLAAAIRSLPQLGVRGVNITIPHKESVMLLLNEVDEEASEIGAVNTIVVNANGTLRGMNTDAYGFAENIRPHLPKSRNKAVVLGAGGASKAILHVLLNLGFKEVVLLNRTRARAEELSYWFADRLQVRDWQDRAQALEGADLLVNTTSLGMMGHEPLELDLSALPKRALVTDIVYAPLMTPLLTQAHARGNPVIDGLGMLLHQAVPGFEVWFGRRPEVTPQLREYILGENKGGQQAAPALSSSHRGGQQTGAGDNKP